MLSFLEETIQTIQKKHGDISDHILILPSKRAGGFLKNFLLKHARKTVFSPKIISVEEFIEELSSLQIITADELLIKSYQAYLTTEGITKKESFEEYASWANTLLNDFSEIDRYLVNPKAFFNYLSGIKTLEKWGVTGNQTDMIKNYLEFWDHLFEYYSNLNQLLLREQLGYQGMAYRKAAEDIEHYIANHGPEKHIFIGFNALNTSEQQIIQELLETGHTEVFWDIDDHFYADEQHSASLFIRGYLKEWKYYQNNSVVEIPNNFVQDKNITIVKAQNNMDQVMYLGNLLSSFSEDELNTTTIVLADESLLVPVLYSLPPNVNQANVTMGLPLGLFPTSGFFESLLKVHGKPSGAFYFKSVVALLNHPLSQNLLVHPESIVTQISEQNRAYISLEKLMEIGGEANKEVLEILFGDWDNDGRLALNNCRKLLRHLRNSAAGKTIQWLVWLKLDEVFKRISSLSTTYSYLEKVSTIARLFTELTSSMSLDFEGDAYNGLQIMGVLETRGLDFENVIMLSVNEGTLPAGKSNTSFITYDLKKQFGLPLYTEKDAIYTYHFYRLLHRVKNATLVYNSFSHGLNSGEKSRYLLQLEIENLPSHALRFETIDSAVTIQKKHPNKIGKTKAVSLRLQEMAGAYFSPSALTGYIRNPIDFYYQKILKINETQEVEETVAYSTMGNIVHNALENLYKPFEGSYLEVAQLKEIKGQIAKEVSFQFQENFRGGDFTKGKNLIIFEVAKRYVENLIQLDMDEIEAGNTIKIAHIEAELKTRLHLPELSYPVFLGGKIDRVDLYNDQLRIIDYKTGNVKQAEVEITEWDVITSDYKYSKAFQVLSYALLIRKELSYDKVEAGVISFKNLSGNFLKFAKREKARGGTKHTIITEEITDAFILELKKLILEICDPACPFTEKEITK